MMRRLPVCILSILFIISLLPSLAQTPALCFDTLTWDFGTVAEAGGRVTHRFGFANRSGRPVVVTDVVATCGCTVPVYSKRPVLPGERSEIAVTFDPMNRPGRFDKAVSVFTSESGDPIRLRITGRVTPRERSVEELYPCDLGGGLRLRDRLGQRVVGTDRTDVALWPAEWPPDGERAGAARCGGAGVVRFRIRPACRMRGLRDVGRRDRAVGRRGSCGRLDRRERHCGG